MGCQFASGMVRGSVRGSWICLILAMSGCGPAPRQPVRLVAAGQPRPVMAPESGPSTGLPVRVPVVIAPPKPFRLASVEANGEPSSRRRDVAGPATPPVVGSEVVQIGAVEPMLVGRRQSDQPTDPLHLGRDEPLLTEIRDMLAGYLSAFNRHDAVALAGHWTADGENLDLESGRRTQGRDAVEQVFRSLFSVDATASIDLDVESIRRVGNDTAIVDGVSRMTFTDDAVSSRFSAVLVRQSGHWLLHSVRESSEGSGDTDRAEPPPRGLAALAWLRGAWEDVDEGVTMSTQTVWALGDSFLVRSHLVTADAPDFSGAALRQAEDIPALLPAESVATDEVPRATQATREITEIIGWDRVQHRPRSWLFDSAGDFAEASWESSTGSCPGEEHWHVRILLPGETEPVCEYSLTRLGEDELVIEPLFGQSAFAPPAREFLRTARPSTP